MKSNKLHFVIDNTIKAKAIEKDIFKKYKNFSIKNSNIIIVIGGDGFMLQSLKKFQKYNKPFYGLNRGSFGFLMNRFNKENILKRILKSKMVSISPLEAKIKAKNNSLFKAIAINDVSLLRQSRQTSSLKIMNKNKINN